MLDFNKLQKKEKPIAIIGLGYVGLPLAAAFARHFAVIGFDVSQARIAQLQNGHDATGEVGDLAALNIAFTCDPGALKRAAVLIVAVPTPIDKHYNPDLQSIISASQIVGANMSPGCVVVYESTVYPGLTEDICVPVLEESSGMRLGADFKVGYSPERINPGDREHTLENITKIVSACDADTLQYLTRVYGTVVKAGIHQAPSMRIAEAAKVIENTQRDINIALMNELSLIFGKMNIDTLNVLEAAGTKWNFLPFRPGLVGGHCIGVDPYYLTYKAQEIGYHPEIILAGRRLNDNMGRHVAAACVKNLSKLESSVFGAKVGVWGITFKENLPDIRNSKVIDIIRELHEYGINVMVHDPLADAQQVLDEYNINLSKLDEFANLDALILAVPHKQYAQLDIEELTALFRNRQKALLLDLKGMWNMDELQGRGIQVWRL